MSESLVGHAVVYRVCAADDPRKDHLGLGRQARTLVGGVWHDGSSFHRSLFEFAGQVIAELPESCFELDLLVPGLRLHDPATRRQVTAVLQGEGGGQFRLAGPLRLPGFPAVYRVPAEDEFTRGGETNVGCSLHPNLTAFAAIGGLFHDDGSADLELTVPGVPGRMGINELKRTWVCNVPEGRGPGQFQFV